MYWKRLRPYVIELIVFLLIVAGLSVFFSVTHAITIEWSILFVLLIVVVFLWLVQYVFSFVPFALLVIADFAFQNYSTVTAKFKRQFIFKSSSFLDKNRKIINEKEGMEKVETLFYKVVVETEDGIQVFTSSEYFELLPDISYVFIYGCRSKALVDIQKIEKR